MLLLGASGVVGAGWSACSIYDSSLLLPGVDAGGPDVGAFDAGPLPDATPARDADTCPHERWPSRPASDTPGDASTGSIVLALTSLNLGFPTDAGLAPQRLGYDLDERCTCPGPESCKTAVPVMHCDEDGGRDNSIGGIIQRFGAFGGVLDPTGIAMRLKLGIYGLAVRIVGYNGGADDTKVRVEVYVSAGMDGVQYDGGKPTPPAYDGNDRWTVDPSSLLGGNPDGTDCGNDNVLCVPKNFDDNAYVSGGVLVSSLPELPLSLGTNAIAVLLVGSVVTGTLTQDAVGYRLDDAQIVGRWATKNLLPAFQVFGDPFAPGGHLCGDSGTYQNLKVVICQNADITSFPTEDNMNAPCDSVSAAFGFTASAAKLGVVSTHAPSSTPCGPGWTDDCP